MHVTPDSINDGSDIFAFTFECIAVGIAAVATSPSIDGPHAEVTFKSGQYRCPCEMIARSAVHKEQRLSRATMPAGDGGAIL